MTAKNINGELRSTVAKQKAMIALQQKEFHAATAQQAKEIKALAATVKEQASQIQAFSCARDLRVTN
jgi:septal ring factor EnvC (AmiA/AmiB activator)